MNAVLEKSEREANLARWEKPPKAQELLEVNAVPGTILLFRSDVYDYTCRMTEFSPDQSLMTSSNFLTPGLHFEEVEFKVEAKWHGRRGICHSGPVTGDSPQWGSASPTSLQRRLEVRAAAASLCCASAC